MTFSVALNVSSPIAMRSQMLAPSSSASRSNNFSIHSAELCVAGIKAVRQCRQQAEQRSKRSRHGHGGQHEGRKSVVVMAVAQTDHKRNQRQRYRMNGTGQKKPVFPRQQESRGAFQQEHNDCRAVKSRANRAQVKIAPEDGLSHSGHLPGGNRLVRGVLIILDRCHLSGGNRLARGVLIILDISIDARDQAHRV